MSERPHPIEADALREQPHIIEIDSIVLDAPPGTRPQRLAARIEAEVGRALAGSTVPGRTLAHREPRVAGEIARTVVRAMGTSAHDA